MLLFIIWSDIAINFKMQTEAIPMYYDGIHADDYENKVILISPSVYY